MSRRRSSDRRAEPPCYDSDQRLVDQWIAEDPTFAVDLLRRLGSGDSRARMAIELAMAAGRPPDRPDVDRLRRLIRRSLEPDKHMTWRDEDTHWRRVADVVAVIAVIEVIEVIE
nr:hypothetical protein [Planctomycetota bacterium]